VLLLDGQPGSYKLFFIVGGAAIIILIIVVLAIYLVLSKPAEFYNEDKLEQSIQERLARKNKTTNKH